MGDAAAPPTAFDSWRAMAESCCSYDGPPEEECVDLSAALNVDAAPSPQLAIDAAARRRWTDAESQPQRERVLLLWAWRHARSLRALPRDIVTAASKAYLRTAKWPPLRSWQRRMVDADGQTAVCSTPDQLAVGAAIRSPLPAAHPCMRSVAVGVVGQQRPPRYIGLAEASSRAVQVDRLGLWDEGAEGLAIVYDSHNGGLFGGARWPIVPYGGLPHIAESENGGIVLAEIETAPPALLLRWPLATRRRGIITATPINGAEPVRVDPEFGRGHRHFLHRDGELWCDPGDLHWVMIFTGHGDAAEVVPH
eukprot:TRINITY_DN47383_c0_g1_i1.p2 TRINITY_DN47383_c0_g1~~TRINITY_DN47383_c0_g1_i1.p2  ORF type:complete len:308 (+),score=107.53 TRINITY_DN47383_c0_g1_i1:92-1015(+)